MSIDLSQFIGEFLQESFEGLDLMESCLLEFDGDPEVVDSIFRAAHSIKGGAGTFGFSEIAEFTHCVETILDEMRSDTIETTSEIVNCLLESVDVLRGMLNATQDEEEVAEEIILAVKVKLQTIIDDNNLTSSDPDSNLENTTEPTTIESLQNADYWIIEFKPSLNMLQSGNEPVFIFEALEELGDLKIEPNLEELPETDSFDAENIYLWWSLKLTAFESDPKKIRQEIEEVFEWVDDFCQLSITPALSNDDIKSVSVAPLTSEDDSVSSTEKSDQVANTKQQNILDEAKKANKKANSIEVSSVRVDTEKLDELMDRVGELVVTQAMLTQAGIDLLKSGYNNQRLEQGLAQLESNTRDLQEDVMRMRMLPISFVFNRFPRLVHDISLSLGKKVSLDMGGTQTEIDKTVMEKIGDPLTHLIRNALDHGLETPDQRLACGKSETGTIQLNAYHQNGFIVIDIIDDGKGLDAEKIRAKALEKKLISEEQVLSEDDIHSLIFKPGFSTVDQLSELSGRGVGMDVVLRNIESLGGQVNLSSQKDVGSTFSVSVPLTLAIIEGQLILINGEMYVIPLVSIMETVLTQASEIKYLGAHSQFIDYRDEYIHLIDLREMFSSGKQSHSSKSIDKSDEEPLLIIVAESSGKKVGFIIDELDGQQQFVVKPLETNFKKMQGLVGGTILGDGNVALILDTAGLILKDERLNNVVPINEEIALP